MTDSEKLKQANQAIEGLIDAWFRHDRLPFSSVYFKSKMSAALLYAEVNNLNRESYNNFKEKKEADTRTDIERSIDTINKALEEDQGYHYAWQSNIAMAFQDELSRRGYKLPDQHAISNEAAKNFLNNLMSHSKKR